MASTAEMALDDSVRYANKAEAAGSPVELRLWDHMEHVWPFFAPILDEGEAAFDHIVDFVEAQRRRDVSRRRTDPLPVVREHEPVLTG